MLVLVTEEAQQFPIAAVWRVVFVVVVLVMHGEIVQRLPLKVAPAPRAHRREERQRSRPKSVLAPVAISANPGNRLVQVVVAVNWCH